MSEVIPEAAVEAAARALWEPNEHGDEWASEFPTYKDYLRSEATKALEAAATHMLAEAWDASGKATADYELAYRIAFDYGDDLPEPPTNPYRRQG